MSAAAPVAPPARAARILSPSQASQFLACAASWYFKHELRLPEPATSSIALGRAVHSACAAALRGKGAGAKFTTEDVLRLYDEFAARELAQAELRTEEDQAAIAAEGRALVALYCAQVLPEAQPQTVESFVSGRIAGVPVRGIVDLLEADAVAELKTSARRPAGIPAAHRLQLTTYAMLTGRSQARVDTLIHTKTPAHVRHTIPIEQSDRDFAETIYPLVADAMCTGLYPPNRGSVLCSRRNCAFWRACEREFGGAVD